MRVMTCLSVLFLALTPESAAETIEVSKVGAQRVMGTLLGVRVDGDSLLVKVRLDNNLEQHLPFETMPPAGQDKVLALMVSAARINGTKIPALKFSASKKTESNLARGSGGFDQVSNKTSYTTHELSVLNSGALATDLNLYQLSRTVRTQKFEGATSGKMTMWDLYTEAAAALQPGERRKVSFPALAELSHKTVNSRTVTVRSSGKNIDTIVSSRKSVQENIEAVYLMAFDAAGALIYFVKASS